MVLPNRKKTAKGKAQQKGENGDARSHARGSLSADGQGAGARGPAENIARGLGPANA